MALLSLTQLDEAIEALALGAESWTAPNGVTVKRTSLDSLLKWRDARRAADPTDGAALVPQFVEFA